MAELGTANILCGLFSFILVLALTVVRQRRFDSRDIGSFAAAFIAGSSIPSAFVVCVYGLWPDPPGVQTKLHGYERFIFFAGLVALVLIFQTIWTLGRKAYVVSNSPEKDKD
jgi:hypothetical protein